MTTDLFDLHPSHEPTDSKPTWRFWVSLAASGLLIGALYAIWTHPGSAGAPEPPPEEGAAVSLAGLDEPAEERARPKPSTEDRPATQESDLEPEPRVDLAVHDESKENEEPVESSEVQSTEAEGAANRESAGDERPGPAPAPVDYATDGAYYVQVASYRTKEHADAHAERLSARDLPAQSLAYGGPSAGWWHTVRLGPFETRPAAEAARFGLERHERLAAYVLPRSNGKYHVQVASFAKRAKAEQIAEQFAAQGHATKISRVRMSGSYWHCVRIGPFDTREEARGYKKLVDDIAGTTSRVIPFGPPEQK